MILLIPNYWPAIREISWEEVVFRLPISTASIRMWTVLFPSMPTPVTVMTTGTWLQVVSAGINLTYGATVQNTRIHQSGRQVRVGTFTGNHFLR
ncbi:hypothetical protein D3C87_1288880 [compost metagenome]